MATYLLTWNPKRWPMADMAETVGRFERTGRLNCSWSCSRTKKIQLGDRVFLLRQGAEPRGIIGSGQVTGEPTEDRMWNDRISMFVDVEWDLIQMAPVIGRNELVLGRLSEVNWNTQSSGIEIRELPSAELFELWSERIGGGIDLDINLESKQLARLPEGAVVTTRANRYERSSTLRSQCLSHWGIKCQVCDMDPQEVYGKAGQRIIHVHHLHPLGEIRKEHLVDPKVDLVPVCPNCHALIHSRSMPMDVKTARRILGRVARK